MTVTVRAFKQHCDSEALIWPHSDTAGIPNRADEGVRDCRRAASAGCTLVCVGRGIAVRAGCTVPRASSVSEPASPYSASTRRGSRPGGSGPVMDAWGCATGSSMPTGRATNRPSFSVIFGAFRLYPEGSFWMVVHLERRVARKYRLANCAHVCTKSVNMLAAHTTEETHFLNA